MESTTVAVDLAKSVFEVAVANERGQIQRAEAVWPDFVHALSDEAPRRAGS